MAKFDIESFRDFWLEKIKAGLPAKLDQIMTEKGDSLKLENFKEDQWTNDLNEKVMNYPSFVLYSLNITNPETVGEDMSREITLLIEVVFTSYESGILAENKILRYTRAMAEIALENSQKNASISEIKVEELIPVDIRTSLSTTAMKTGAVQITGTIAG